LVVSRQAEGIFLKLDIEIIENKTSDRQQIYYKIRNIENSVQNEIPGFVREFDCSYPFDFERIFARAGSNYALLFEVLASPEFSTGRR